MAAPVPVSSSRTVGGVSTAVLVEAEPTTWPGTIGWGLATATLVAGATVLARRPRLLLTRVAVRAVATPPALVGLYLCFVNLERRLPLY